MTHDLKTTLEENPNSNLEFLLFYWGILGTPMEERISLMKSYHTLITNPINA